MGQVQGSPPPPWSDLPQELLGLVFLRLPTRADRAFFLGVCRRWYSAVRQCHLPAPSPVPWLLLPDGSATSFPHGETFKLQLLDGVRYHKSYGEWLLMSNNDGSCFLMNHFTKVTLPLPSLSSYTYDEEPVELPEHYMYQHNDSDRRDIWLILKDRGEVHVASVVVCSTRLIAAIIAIGAPGTIGSLGTIALCRPGAAAWSVSAHQEEYRWFSDMVFLQGKVYTLDCTLGNDLISIDIVDEYDSEPRVSRMERIVKGIPLPCQKESICVPYILESQGTLLMIDRKFSYKRQNDIFVAGSIKFDVFEADFEQHLWAEVRTLGNDQALFVGQGYSRAVRLSPYDVSRDCIFFLDDCLNWVVKKTIKSCGVYDMKDEKVYSPLPVMSLKSGKVPPSWIFSQGEAAKFQMEAEC